MGTDHPHVIAAGPTELRARQTRVLWAVLALNGAFLGVEVVAGVVFGSLALLADAAHMLSDVVAISIALVTQYLMARPRTERHTFGWLRAEALGAQANAALLVASTIWIVVEAFDRIGTEHQIAGRGLFIVATLGLAVNLGSAAALLRVRTNNLNIEGAYVHMMADALGSVGAITAGLAIWLAGAMWVDTAASLLIAAMVLVGAWRLLRSTTRVLMEGTPKGIDTATVTEAISAEPGVEGVHHVHLWSLSSDSPALSAHVVLGETIDLHDAQVRGDALRSMLHDRFGIAHTTLDLECHMCEDEPHGLGSPSG